MGGTWEVVVSTKATAQQIKSARVKAEAEAFAHGVSKDEVKVVFALETE